LYVRIISGEHKVRPYDIPKNTDISYFPEFLAAFGTDKKRFHTFAACGERNRLEGLPKIFMPKVSNFTSTVTNERRS
jgi:hypothetical protein